jgi:hypothetical protein
MKFKTKIPKTIECVYNEGERILFDVNVLVAVPGSPRKLKAKGGDRVAADDSPGDLTGPTVEWDEKFVLESAGSRANLLFLFPGNIRLCTELM